MLRPHAQLFERPLVRYWQWHNVPAMIDNLEKRQAAARTRAQTPAGLRSIPRWAIFVVGMYAGAALLTLGFQTYVRLEQCSGYTACTASVAKGVVWSAIWPASWPVYAAGFIRHPSQEAMARLKNDIQADRIGIVHRRFPCRSPDLHFFGYRFRVIVGKDFGEGDICLNLSTGRWSWRILPGYPLSRLNPHD
jgi:hypothetical protein